MQHVVRVWPPCCDVLQYVACKRMVILQFHVRTGLWEQINWRYQNFGMLRCSDLLFSNSIIRSRCERENSYSFRLGSCRFMATLRGYFMLTAVYFNVSQLNTLHHRERQWSGNASLVRLVRRCSRYISHAVTVYTQAFTKVNIMNSTPCTAVYHVDQ